MPVPPPQRTKIVDRWEYAGGAVPRHWDFNPNNPGRVELLADGAAAGKFLMRVKGVNSFVEQELALPDGKHDLKVRLRAKGKGELLVRLRRADGTYAAVLTESVDSAEWRQLSAVAHCEKSGRMVLAFRISGEIDLDDVGVSSEEPEIMPDAQKH